MSKTYFITGCNRGIGLELLRYASKDPLNTVVATVRDSSKVTGDFQILADSSANIKIATLDLSSEASIDGVDAQLSKLVPEGIDVFINNAATATDGETPLNASWDAYVSHFAANAIGPMKLIKVLKPHMLKKETRQIFLMTTSLAAMSGHQFTPGNVYAISKAALNLGAISASLELKPEGFIVVTTDPGTTDTTLFNDGWDIIKGRFPEHVQKMVLSGVKPPAAAAKGLFENVVYKATPEYNGKSYSFNGESTSY